MKTIWSSRSRTAAGHNKAKVTAPTSWNNKWKVRLQQWLLTWVDTVGQLFFYGWGTKTLKKKKKNCNCFNNRWDHQNHSPPHHMCCTARAEEKESCSSMFGARSKKGERSADGEIDEGVWGMVWMACISSLVIKRLFYTQKAAIDCTVSERERERVREYLLGEFTRYLFFALGLGVGVGGTINACLMWLQA